MRKMRCESYKECIVKEEKKKRNREREEIVLRIEKMKSNIFNKKTIMMYHTLFYNCPV